MIRKVIVSVIAVCLLAAIGVAVESTMFSDASNAGFESGLEGWQITKGWSECPPDIQKRNLSIRSDGAKQGRRYLRVENDLDDRFLGIKQEVKWEPDTVYKASWWTRGHTSGKRGFRLRVEGSGSPPDALDGSYTSEDWTYHEYSFYSSSASNGWIALWIWPTDGYCDIDAFTIRKAFWKADRSEYMPGQTAILKFEMNSQGGSQLVKVDYELQAPGGEVVKADSFQGRTPLKRIVRAKVETPGYYVLKSTAASGDAELTDTVGFCVLPRTDGEEALKALWAE